jgi:hypothetical protein
MMREKPIISFESQRAWEVAGQESQHFNGIWVRFAKKASGSKSV